jgi:hypothetical protein
MGFRLTNPFTGKQTKTILPGPSGREPDLVEKVGGWKAIGRKLKGLVRR